MEDVNSAIIVEVMFFAPIVTQFYAAFCYTYVLGLSSLAQNGCTLSLVFPESES